MCNHYMYTIHTYKALIQNNAPVDVIVVKLDTTVAPLNRELFVGGKWKLAWTIGSQLVGY